jgi:hypothetical protein
LDKEKAKRNLKDILNRMESDTDAVQFHEYYKLFKKEIPLFKRSWAAAWLFRYYDGKETPRFQFENVPKKDKKNITNNAVTSAESQRSGTPSGEISIPEEESKRLFISIGKNRRLFPKEVITLIMSKTSAAREDIGVIRILDNFSFVQVRDTKADEIIKTLTGHRFRGRTLTVNFAKPKIESEDAYQ